MKFIEPCYKEIDKEKPEAPSCILTREGGGNIKMCQHPDCFSMQNTVSIVEGALAIKVRIAGQAQFNKDLRCSRYKQKWWEFLLFIPEGFSGERRVEHKEK
jgi:hypothetical protein